MAQNKYHCPLCEWSGKTLKELGRHIYQAHEKMEEDIPDYLKAIYKNKIDEEVELSRGILQQIKIQNEKLEEMSKDLRIIKNRMKRY